MRYEFVITGRLSETVAAASPELKIFERPGRGTTLSGTAIDRADLGGLMARFSNIGLEAIDIHRLRTGQTRQPRHDNEGDDMPIVAYCVIDFVIQSVVQPKFVGGAVSLSLILTFLSLVFWSFVIDPLGAVLAITLTLLAKALLLDVDPRSRWITALLSGANPIPAPNSAPIASSTPASTCRARLRRIRLGLPTSFPPILRLEELNHEHRPVYRYDVGRAPRADGHPPGVGRRARALRERNDDHVALTGLAAILA